MANKNQPRIKCPDCGEKRAGWIVRAFSDDQAPHAMRCAGCGVGFVPPKTATASKPERR